MSLYSFSHFLTVWIFPPGLILIILCSGLLIGYRFLRLGKALILTATVLLWALSTPMLSQHLIDGLQNQYVSLEKNASATQPSATAIVVLGAGTANNNDVAHSVAEKGLARLHYAADLYQYRRVPIIVSGGNKNSFGMTEAQAMHVVLKKFFLIEEVFTEDKSKNTREEGDLLWPLLKQQKIDSIYLVTHAWHMPRSMQVLSQAFKGHNIRIIPAPMGYVLLKSNQWLVNFYPTINALNTSIFALHEYVGMMWYQLFY